jgi:hypothetical protein
MDTRLGSRLHEVESRKSRPRDRRRRCVQHARRVMSDAEPPRPYFCGRIRPRPRHFRERPRPIRAAGSFSSATAPFSELRYDKRGMGETVYLTYRGLKADRRIGRVFVITVRETYLSTGRRAASGRLARASSRLLAMPRDPRRNGNGGKRQRGHLISAQSAPFNWNYRVYPSPPFLSRGKWNVLWAGCGIQRGA